MFSWRPAVKYWEGVRKDKWRFGTVYKEFP